MRVSLFQHSNLLGTKWEKFWLFHTWNCPWKKELRCMEAGFEMMKLSQKIKHWFFTEKHFLVSRKISWKALVHCSNVTSSSKEFLKFSKKQDRTTTFGNQCFTKKFYKNLSILAVAAKLYLFSWLDHVAYPSVIYLIEL